MASLASLLPVFLLLSVTDCWRPMIRRDPLRDPTFEYTPPLYYWNEDPPPASLIPPPPGPPLPWLSTHHTSPDHTQAFYPTQPLSTTYRSTTTSTTTTSKPTTTTVTTTTTRSTAPPPAMVIQGHSKVKKYGPVEGSVNSVFVHSGKRL